MVRKLRRLRPRDFWGLGMAYLYLLQAGCQMVLRREQLDRWRSGAGAQGPVSPAALNTIARRARWVNTAARYPLPWARCLQRSLALCIWLRRLGFSPALQIGVRMDGAALSAHAWVELGGRVINDNPRAVKEFAALQSADLNLAGGNLSRGRRWI